MKKGFTLVELLAVIVILAVILVIAVPQINNVIKETRKNSLGSTAKLIAAKAEEKEVENDALEKTETITCADLVKLDNNYGNCTVTKNSTTGKWEVTIVGSNKFSGYTCTGTKDSMSCTERDTNTPEYVYSFLEPYYDYTYEVKEGKTGECITYLENNMKDNMITDWEYTVEEAQSEIEAVCDNTIPSEDSDASEFFADAIAYGFSTYEDISSFVGRNGSGELVNAVEDYTTLKYPETNEQAQVFIRWNGNETSFSDTSKNSVCTLYGSNLTCFEEIPSAYETNKGKLQTLFGSDKCQVDRTLTDSEITYTSCNDGWWKCKAFISGNVMCYAPDVNDVNCGEYINSDGKIGLCSTWNRGTSPEGMK